MTLQQAFDGFIADLQRKGAKPSTIEAYRRRLRFFTPLLYTKLSTITETHINNLVNGHVHSGQRRSYRCEYSLLVSIYKYYLLHDDTITLPNCRILLDTVVKRPLLSRKYLTKEELLSFIAALKDQKVSYYASLATIQAQTGMRVGEAMALKWGDVDLKRGRIAVRRTVWWKTGATEPVVEETTKTGQYRECLITKDLQTMLESIPRGRSEDFLVGGVVNLSAVHAAYNRAFKSIGLGHTGTHTLRHTFATLYYGATKDLLATQHVMGHASVTSTQRYAKVTEDVLEKYKALVEKSL